MDNVCCRRVVFQSDYNAVRVSFSRRRPPESAYGEVYTTLAYMESPGICAYSVVCDTGIHSFSILEWSSGGQLLRRIYRSSTDGFVYAEWS